jgi:hypothetical protein
MVTTTTDYIRHRLQRYEASVDHIRACLRDPSAAGNFTASAPFAEQCAIPVLLASLAGNPGEEAALRQDYARITKKFEALLRESGPGYRERLFKDLESLAHAYHASACHAGICNLPHETATDPCGRRLISLLQEELRKDYDVSGVEALLSVIDENLRRLVPCPGKEGAGSSAAGEAYATVTDTETCSSRGNSGQIRIG